MSVCARPELQQLRHEPQWFTWAISFRGRDNPHTQGPHAAAPGTAAPVLPCAPRAGQLAGDTFEFGYGDDANASWRRKNS